MRASGSENRRETGRLMSSDTGPSLAFSSGCSSPFTAYPLATPAATRSASGSLNRAPVREVEAEPKLQVHQHPDLVTELPAVRGAGVQPAGDRVRVHDASGPRLLREQQAPGVADEVTAEPPFERHLEADFGTVDDRAGQRIRERATQYVLRRIVAVPETVGI